MRITGGQYSLFRIAFGTYLFVHLVSLLPYGAEVFSSQGVLPQASNSPLIGVFPNLLGAFDAPGFVVAFILFGSLAAVSFALGAGDRIAAVLLWYVWACLYGRNPLISNPGLPYVGWMLLAHAFVPRAPYLSFAARGRPDPDNGWRMPMMLFGVAWFLMAAGYSFSGVTKLVSPSWLEGTALQRVLESPLARPTFLREWMLSLPGGVLAAITYPLLAFEILFLPLALFRKLRLPLWLGMLSMHFGILMFVAFADLTFGMVMLHLFTFDPAWVPPAHPDKSERLFYDGGCGLCHRAVRMILAEDTSGTAFRFAPLGGEAFAALSEERRAGLPDSIVLETAEGELLVRSAAARHVLVRLGGWWRVIGTLFAIVPPPVLDFVYDIIARVRHRVFARPSQVCPVIPAALRTRFDA